MGQLRDTLESLLEKELPDPDGPGAVLGVIDKNGELITAVRGLANLEHRVPISADTVFHVASVSKQFTAYAVRLLVDEGRLEFDDRVAGMLPWFPHDDVTVAQLITHRSGLRDHWQLIELSGGRMEDVITTAVLIALISAQRGLDFPPGSDHRYSNSNYTTLAALVETISGQSLAEFCAERIFRPLGMSRTLFLDDHHRGVPDRADSYRRADDGYRRIVLSYSTAGATSLNTTIPDLSRWLRHAAEPEVHDRRIDTGLGDADYRLGVQITSWLGRTVVEHGGADAGYRCYFTAVPERGVAAMIMSNFANCQTRLLGRQALLATLGESPGDQDDLVQRPEEIDWSAIPSLSTTAEELAGYSGCYLSQEVAAMQRIERSDDGLILIRPRRRPFALQRIADRVFVVRSVEDSEWPVLVITFAEDAQALSLSVDGARDVGFHRVEPPVAPTPNSSTLPAELRSALRW